VVFSEARWPRWRRLGLAESAVEERAILAQVIGQLYRWAGEQSPIMPIGRGISSMTACPEDGLHRPRGDDDPPAAAAGRARHAALSCGGADPAPGALAGAQHFSAVIRENARRAGSGGAFVVDTWFGEHGDPAVVLPLEDWLDGEGPNVS
jgi:hypothetical protein